MALVDDLRALSLSLPPNFRVSGGEVADLLGALIAYTEHGDGLTDASGEGPQAVADFFHDASGAGDELRGAPVVAAAPAGAPAPAAPGPSKADFDRLEKQIASLLKAQTTK